LIPFKQAPQHGVAGEHATGWFHGRHSMDRTGLQETGRHIEPEDSCNSLLQGE
jgi:hypothetical protein